MNLIKESSLVKYGMKPLIHLDDLLRNGGGLKFQGTFLPNADFFFMVMKRYKKRDTCF